MFVCHTAPSSPALEPQTPLFTQGAQDLGDRRFRDIREPRFDVCQLEAGSHRQRDDLDLIDLRDGRSEHCGHALFELGVCCGEHPSEREPREPVFNIEVHQARSYCASTRQLLVHNSCADEVVGAPTQLTTAMGKKTRMAHMAKQAGKDRGVQEGFDKLTRELARGNIYSGKGVEPIFRIYGQEENRCRAI